MTKKEYIIKQIKKTNKKNYENYVITRIINLLNDLDIKFVTQQYVKRENGYALADLYFPQFNYFVEVDESHHLTQKEADKARDRDFVKSVNFNPERIDVDTWSENANKSGNVLINDIHDQINNIVEEIRTLKKQKIKNGSFIPWDIDKEYSPITWIIKGKICLDDNVAFRKSVDACKIFGKNYLGWQRGGAEHPDKDTIIWFPKLYKNEEWNNSYDYTTGEIVEYHIESQQARKEHYNKYKNIENQRRIVFAHVRDNLGDTLYRFRGIYKLDREKTSIKNGLVWNRVSNCVETIDYRNNK